MSNEDKPNEPAAPEGARPDPAAVAPMRADPPSSRPAKPAAKSPAPRPRGGGSIALALLLSLIAVGAAGYVGWQQWQQAQTTAADGRGVDSLQQRVSTLESTVSGISGERDSLSQRLNDAAAVNRSLREELLGQAQRTRNLEDAVAKLAEKSLSSHDTMLLNETESLLRMAGERYRLFHDAQGAAAAYALADQTLAAVNDSAFTGLRQSIDAEREALARSQPVSQANALQQLITLRGNLDTLPLKRLDRADQAPAPDAWSRIGHALASVITIQRDNGAPLAVADARFARELAKLDLAQAQAALLAHDSSGYQAALKRVDGSLSTAFDLSAPDVQQARQSIAALADALPVNSSVQLGAALTELQNLRAVHAIHPTTDNPAPAASSIAPAAETKP